MGLDPTTYRRWNKNPVGDRRKGSKSVPANKLSDEERKRIFQIANSKKFQDKPPSQIVPALADDGLYIASESTFYRCLKEEGMLVHRGKQKEGSKVNNPRELVSTGPNEVWSWDITYLRTNIKGMYFYLYLVMDLFDRSIVGYVVSTEQNDEISSQMMLSLCKQEKIEEGELAIHSDNGGPMKGATMLATLQRLGVVPSFNRPRVSDDNPYSESLFRTIKYNPSYPSKPFESIEGCGEWMEKFIPWYNEEHFHSGINFVTPGSRRRGEDVEILTKRRAVYERAKQKNPNRWSGKTRNWDRSEAVTLNPLKTA